MLDPIEIEEHMKVQHRSPSNMPKLLRRIFLPLTYFRHLPTVASAAHHPSPQPPPRGMRWLCCRCEISVPGRACLGYLKMADVFFFRTVSANRPTNRQRLRRTRCQETKQAPI